MMAMFATYLADQEPRAEAAEVIEEEEQAVGGELDESTDTQTSHLMSLEERRLFLEERRFQMEEQR